MIENLDVQGICSWFSFIKDILPNTWKWKLKNVLPSRESLTFWYLLETRIILTKCRIENRIVIKLRQLNFIAMFFYMFLHVEISIFWTKVLTMYQSKMVAVDTCVWINYLFCIIYECKWNQSQNFIFYKMSSSVWPKRLITEKKNTNYQFLPHELVDIGQHNEKSEIYKSCRISFTL